MAHRSDYFLSELFLLVGFGRPRRIEERLHKWVAHATAFARLKGHEPGRWQDSRLSFAGIHLDALDSKFGFLLSFQALLATIMALVINALSLQRLIQAEYLSVRVLLLVGGVLWFVSTLVCLSGMRRLTWGDLGASFEDSGKAEDLSTRGSSELAPTILKTEEAHLATLLRAVVKRTAKFRVAVVISGVTVVGVAAIVTVAWISARGSAIGTTGADDTGRSMSYLPQTSCLVQTSSAPAAPRFQLVDSQVTLKGHPSHTHTFLLDNSNGDLWQMTCGRGAAVVPVEFKRVDRDKGGLPAHSRN